MSAGRNWCFALKHPEFDPCTLEWPSHVRYAVWSVHAADDGPALHGYVEMNYNIRQPKRLVPGATFSRRLMSRDDARMHCMRLDSLLDGPWEYGTWELCQGRRKDLSSGSNTNVADIPESGVDGKLVDVLNVVRTLAEENKRLAQNVEMLQAVMHEKAAAPMPAPVTIIHNTYNVNNVVTNNTANIVTRDLRFEDLTEFPEERIKELISQTRSGFIAFVKETRFNSEKPQNRNVKIMSKKKNLAAVKKGGEWMQNSIAQSLEEVLDASKAQFFRPLDDPSYMGHLIDNEPPVMDWCQKVMSKRPLEWRPIKNSVRAELERVYNDERAMDIAYSLSSF